MRPMDDIITLAYGSGGKKTSELIEEMLLPAFGNDILGELGDGAILPNEPGERLVMSTDSFVVTPYVFPGGDIGKLAVCGTVNDIAVSGGEPKYLSLAVILEEGIPTADVARIVCSIAETAKRANVRIVTGDTKVVEHGKADGLFINTTGIGVLRHPGLSPKAIREGDVVLVSGTVGDHGTCVMLARNPNLVRGGILSDCAPLYDLTKALRPLGTGLRVMRDPTRGGVATTLNEFTEGTALSIELDESAIPVKKEVRSASDILGLDPLYSANEGKILAVVAPGQAEEALRLLRSVPEGRDACAIGRVTASHPGKVLVRTPYGGSRILVKLAGAQLPRIC